MIRGPEVPGEVNQLLKEAAGAPALAGKRPIALLVIRPEAAIPLSVTDFNRQDITSMLDLGRQRARSRVDQAKADPNDPGHDIATSLH